MALSYKACKERETVIRPLDDWWCCCNLACLLKSNFCRKPGCLSHKQKTLSGRVRFLVPKASRVGIPCGNAIAQSWAAIKRSVTNLLILYLLFVTCHTLNGAQHVLSTAYGRSVPRVLQYLFRLWPDVLIEHLYYAFLDCTDLNRSR